MSTCFAIASLPGWRALFMGSLLVWVGAAHALFYDPFVDADSVKPADELEQRIWEEAETFRGQFAHSRPSPQLAQAQRSVQAVLSQHWPALAPKLNLQVIDNADVLAVSSANGDLFISTGMLLRLDTEDELTAILAREVSHVVNRHALRTVYAARLGAGANVVFQAAVNANSFIGTMGLLGSYQVSPEMLLADGGKAFIQTQLGKLKDNMADSLVRSMSTTGFNAMVKTSLFGYAESLEVESDDFAMRFLIDHGAPPETYVRVMQRLLDEALADEKKFSAFYANADRLQSRLERAKDFDADRAAHPSVGSHGVADAALTSALTASHPAAQSEVPGVIPAAPQPPSHVVTQAAMALPSDALVITPSEGVATVVIGDGDLATPALAEAMPLLVVGVQSGDSPQTKLVSVPVVPYSAVPATLAMPVLEAELEAGHLGRLIKNIDRPRDQVTLPSRAALILAEGCAAQLEPTQWGRSESLTRSYLLQQPQDARALKLMGVLALRQGQLVQARTYLEQARMSALDDDERGFITQYLQQVDKKSTAP